MSKQRPSLHGPDETPATGPAAARRYLPNRELSPERQRELAEFEAIFSGMRRLGLPMAPEQPTTVPTIVPSAAPT